MIYVTFKEFLKPGLSCYLDLTCEVGPGNIYNGVWLVVEEVFKTTFQGKIVDIPGLENDLITFDISYIKRLRGDLDWNIENLYVKVSEEVFKGKEVGYFYNSFEEDPMHYGRSFFSLNEVDKVKSTITMFDYKLKALIKREPFLKEVLSDFAYLGVLKKSDGKFKVLGEKDIIDKPRSVYPSFYEID